MEAIIIYNIVVRHSGIIKDVSEVLDASYGDKFANTDVQGSGLSWICKTMNF